jgi:hypothetical protein
MILGSKKALNAGVYGEGSAKAEATRIMKICLIRNYHHPIQIRKSIRLAHHQCRYASPRIPAPTSLTRRRTCFRLDRF